MRRAFVVGGAVVGSAVGVLLILLAGTVCVDSVGGVDGSYCGLNLLVWNVRTPVGLALAGGLGGVAGGSLGFMAGSIVRRRRPASG
jgi:hypothetical protein